MHSVLRIRHFVVEIFIIISKCVGSVMREVVLVHRVVVQEHTAIEVLGQEVKSNIIDMCWHDLIDRVLLVAPVDRERKWEVTSL